MSKHHMARVWAAMTTQQRQQRREAIAAGVSRTWQQAAFREKRKRRYQIKGLSKAEALRVLGLRP